MFSELTDKVILTDHYDSRAGNNIDKITIHHMAGNLSIETCGNVFQTREASANYGIGTDGRIGGYVPEEYRAWSTANPANDRRAINIELANDGGAETNWHVSDTAIEKCIELCVDICKRYGFSLVYDETPNGSLTRHNMFMATTCPGSYLQSKFPYIANEVNRRLGEALPEAGTWFIVNEEDGLWLLDENKNKIQAYDYGTDVIYQGLGYTYGGYQYYYVQINGDKNYGYMAKNFLTLKYSDVDPIPEPTPSDDEKIKELEEQIQELNNTIALKDKQIEDLIKKIEELNVEPVCKDEFLIDFDNHYRVKIKKGETLLVIPNKDSEYTMNLFKEDIVRIK